MNMGQAPQSPAPRRIAFLMWDITSETADFLFNLSNATLILGALAVLESDSNRVPNDDKCLKRLA